MALQFKIKLKRITKPPVWRRIVISQDATFFDLHKAIQGAFGWMDIHLYRFSDKEFRGELQIGNPEDRMGFGPMIYDAKHVKLSRIFGKNGQKLIYWYDFGDDWFHEITLEEVTIEQVDIPKCTAGKGSCPPENCGGPMGYEMMKEILLYDPESKEAKEYRKWLGLGKKEVFDPTVFDIEEANDGIAEYFSTGKILLDKIPDKVITDIAQSLTCGMVCYLNPDTFEVEELLGDSYDTDDCQDLIDDVMEKTAKWPRCIKIEPLEPYESANMMKYFIEEIIFPSDKTLGAKLMTVMTERKPFRKFKDIVETSIYRQTWFQYRQEYIEEYVKSVIEVS